MVQRELEGMGIQSEVQPRASQSNEGFKRFFGFLVSCGESAEALKFAEAAFDTILCRGLCRTDLAFRRRTPYALSRCRQAGQIERFHLEVLVCVLRVC